MSKSLAFLLFLFGFLQAKSQDYLLFQDEFTVNTHRWEFNKTSSFQAGLREGNLHISHQETNELVCLHEVLLNASRDFRIEAAMTVKTGVSSEGNGLIWGGNDRFDRYYAFVIRPEGYFAVVQQLPGEKKLLCPWTRYKKTGGPGAENILSVKKTGWSLEFSINGKAVYEMPFTKLFGKYHGFLVNGISETAMSWFRIYHPPVEVYLASTNFSQAVKILADSTLNSPLNHETAPRLAANGRTLWFTRSPLEKPFDQGDIWTSVLSGDTAWGEPEILPPPLNNAERNEVAHVFPGNQSLLLASAYFPDGTGNGYGISQTYKNREGNWDIPVEIEIPGYTNEFSPATCQISPDGKTLMISISGTNGYGDLDIYVSFRENNEWSSPRNLGPTLNTSGIEMSPFLMPDGETLFFSSTGHPGYGKADVYRTRRLSNTWTKWSEPENLGPAINTPEGDIYYTPVGGERFAWMASEDSNFHQFDLYKVRIPEDITLQPIVRVYGRVLHSKTKEPLGSEITCSDLSPDSLLNKTQSHAASGFYNIFLPYGRAYQLFAEKVGFYAVTDTLDLRRISQFREIRRDLYLAPIEVGETITLNQVFFQRARAELISDSYPELDRLVLLMRSIPTLKIEIRGHTDNIGNETELQTLSETRAAVVKQYLTDRGISADRTSSRGYGSTLPIASNENPATRSLNRRVEFHILSR
ncbi:MAG: OmpA family protein [Bacteroidia bacterium]|nr:OmpA family protein [Bacteroidia bacterium]